MKQDSAFYSAIFFIIGLLSLAASKAVNFPRDALALGTPCINPDKTKGTCEVFNQCANFSIRSYIRGETGVCGFLPNGDPAVCCHIAPSSSRAPNFNSDKSGSNSQQAGSNSPAGGKAPQPGPAGNPPPTFIIPGINVGFDPNLGDLARIRGQQLLSVRP